METYRKAWTAIWGSVLTIGVVIGLLILPLAGLIWAGIVAVAAALVGVASLRSRQPGEKQNLLRPVAIRTGLITAVMVGAAGLMAFLGSMVLVLALFAAATYPQLICFYHRRLGTVHRPLVSRATTALPPDQITAPLGPELDRYSQPVHQLSDADLCRTWRCTYLVVIRASTAHELNRFGVLRGDCLDELQRRDPAAFAAWIKSGARASSDPEKFFGHNLRNPRTGAV
ncbi:hypothetical protein ACX80O_07455 [Arthrobacter sp. Hz1]